MSVLAEPELIQAATVHTILIFEYNEEDQLYYRYQDGKKQIDEMNKEQLAVSNVVFQYCHGEVRDAKDYLAFGVHGEGMPLYSPAARQ